MTSTPNFSDLAASVRRLKALVVVLVLSNCLLGLLSVYLMRGLDREYSAVLDDSLALLSRIRSLGRDYTDADRSLVAALVAVEPKARQAAETKARNGIAHARATLESLELSPGLQEMPDLLEAMRRTAGEFEAAAGEVIAALGGGGTVEGERRRFERMEAALEQLRVSNRRLLERVELRTQELSDEVSGRLHDRTTLVLGVASWPLIAALVVALLVGSVLAIMLIVLRRAGPDDGP